MSENFEFLVPACLVLLKVFLVSGLDVGGFVLLPEGEGPLLFSLDLLLELEDSVVDFVGF